jgi:hypothetical protein
MREVPGIGETVDPQGARQHHKYHAQPAQQVVWSVVCISGRIGGGSKLGTVCWAPLSSFMSYRDEQVDRRDQTSPPFLHSGL